MNEAISRMLHRYQPKSVKEQERALREILQEIALVGLWRAKFFDQAAFYGGTALRILYGLDRFSEDLDFTLFHPNSKFSWNPFAKTVIDEIRSYGFEVFMDEKVKSAESAIRSAFLKTNTHEAMLLVGQQPLDIHPDTLIRIRVEVDTDPLIQYSVEPHFLREPLPVPIMAVTQTELFASKVHTALFRAWKNRVKGRDWYDLVWFIRKGIKLNLPFLENYMKASDALESTESLTMEKLIFLLETRINDINFESLLADIRPYVRDETVLNEWTPNFFKYWFQKINYSE